MRRKESRGNGLTKKLKKSLTRNLIKGMTGVLMLAFLLGGCKGAEGKGSEKGTDILDPAQISETEETASDAFVPTESPKPEAPELSGEAKTLFSVTDGWKFTFESGAGAWDTTLTVNAQGEFEGEYHDSDLGDTGEGYDNGTLYLSQFTGRFTDVKKISDYVYEAKVTDLTYAEEPEKIQIVDGVRQIFSVANGIAGTDRVRFYLPGAELSILPREYVEWVEGDFGAYVLGKYYRDYPEELPFCGLYNPEEKYGFYSENLGEKNSLYLVNKASFPGLTPDRRELKEDGTYDYGDVSADGSYYVYSLCYRASKESDGAAARNSKAVVEDAISYVMKGQEVRDVYYVDDGFADSFPAAVFINGWNSYMANWTSGSNEDTRYYVARMAVRGNFVYVYGYSASERDDLLHGEAGGFFLSSLTFSGNPERLNCESAGKVAKKICAAVIHSGSDASRILADEVVWVDAGDEELMAKYHLTEEDVTDDYAIVGMDGNYKEYHFNENCPVYVQFPEEGPFQELCSLARFHGKLAEGTYAYLMELYLDENDNVIFAYEPFRP